MDVKKYIQIPVINREFFRDNTRYFVAGGVLLLAVLYQQLIPLAEKAKKNKSVSYQSAWQMRATDIAFKNPEKIFPHVLNSSAGDFYRVGFVAKSLADEKIFLKVVSEAGEEQEITSFDLKKGVEEKYLEAIFSTSGKFQNLAAYVKVPENPDSLWLDKEGIYLSNLSVSRLDAKSEFEAQQLRPTVFGQTEIRKVYLPDNSKERIENKLAEKNAFAGYVFEAPGDYLAAVEMNVILVGNGGKGQYALQIIPEDAWQKMLDSEKLRDFTDEPAANDPKIEEKTDNKYFSAYDTINFLNKNGNQEMGLPARLEKGQRYFVGLINSGVKTDRNNYLKLAKLKKNESDFDAYVALTFTDYSKTENGILLPTGAKIEDLGKAYSYSYRNNHFFTDYFDLFEKNGKTQFNEKNLVATRAQKGNYFTYQFDTIYPFAKMRVLAQQSGREDNYLRMEYSYDNKFWQEIPYVQLKGGPQTFDFTVQDNFQKKTALFIRVSYSGGSDELKKTFGLAEFEVNAIMPK